MEKQVAFQLLMYNLTSFIIEREHRLFLLYVWFNNLYWKIEF